MSFITERKQYFTAVGTKINASFFEKIKTSDNVRSFSFGTTKLQFVRHIESSIERNSYRGIDEDYFVLHIADCKEPLWACFIDRIKGKNNGVSLSKNGVIAVCERIAEFIELFNANSYTHSFTQGKFHEWIKTNGSEIISKTRLTLGGDWVYLSIDKGEGFEFFKIRLQTVVDYQGWFCEYIRF